MDAALALFWLAAGLYALAGGLGALFLLGVQGRGPSALRAVLGAAFVAHMGEIGARGVAGMHPVSSTVDAVGFLAWIMVGAFLAAQAKRRMDAVAAFVAPVALVLLVTAHASPDPSSTEGLGMLGRVHIVLAILGVSAFALAAAVGALYLLEDRSLKRHKVGALVKRGTALETLDRLAYRCVQIGFPIFSVAMVAGAVWQSRRAGAMRLEYPIAMFAWVAFGALIIARHTAGWRGKRAALLTLCGFAATLVVLGLYVVRQVAET